MEKDHYFMLQERDKWQARKRDIEDKIVELDEEEKRLRGELGKMMEQVEYYNSLTKDMKRELQPSSVSSMLKTI